jgi:hypothetical protein
VPLLLVPIIGEHAQLAQALGELLDGAVLLGVGSRKAVVGVGAGAGVRALVGEGGEAVGEAGERPGGALGLGVRREEPPAP